MSHTIKHHIGGLNQTTKIISDFQKPKIAYSLCILSALLFSATFKRKVERLARDILSDPVRVVQGDIGEANEDVTQITEVFKKRDDKWPWLAQHLVNFTSQGAVLIFVTRKDNSEELANKLKGIDMQCKFCDNACIWFPFFPSLCIFNRLLTKFHPRLTSAIDQGVV